MKDNKLRNKRNSCKLNLTVQHVTELNACMMTHSFTAIVNYHVPTSHPLPHNLLFNRFKLERYYSKL